jgi:3-dehydroquinate dehydratase/shikimate dehydrogenase
MKLLCAPVKRWPEKRLADLYEFSEGTRKLLYDRDRNVRFVDIDWQDKIEPLPNLILSYHNFSETPELESVLAEMKHRCSSAMYYKIATFANSTLDALRMLHFQRQHPEVIGLCMGEKGTLTRILSSFTYAPLSEDDKNAPGQLLLSELETIYHWRSINTETRLYALLGDPVRQSIGHLYHNEQFRQNQMNALYVKLVVTAEELPAFFEAIRDFPFYGFSVTAPLKKKIAPGEIINTMYRTQQRWHYCNTDGVAAADVLGDLKGQKVVILGAGGAAKALAESFTRAGAQTTLVQRQEKIPAYDVLVNATSSGDPDFKDHFIPCKTVMDISIRTTPFLLRARARGCRTIDGLPMYFCQALLQSKIWLCPIRDKQEVEDSQGSLLKKRCARWRY